MIWAWNPGTSLRSGAETPLPVGRPSWDPHYWTWRTAVPFGPEGLAGAEVELTFKLKQS